MSMKEQIQRARNQAIREVDEIFCDLINQLETSGEEVARENKPTDYDEIYPLNYNAGEFKGRKPTSVIFGREKVSVGTWTAVFSEVMRRCNSEPSKHQELMKLRNRISGRTRAILSDKPEGMRTPLRVDNKLYVETHYDTPTLVHILLERILKPAGYDFSNIYVALRRAE